MYADVISSINLDYALATLPKIVAENEKSVSLQLFWQVPQSLPPLCWLWNSQLWSLWCQKGVASGGELRTVMQIAEEGVCSIDGMHHWPILTVMSFGTATPSGTSEGWLAQGLPAKQSSELTQRLREMWNNTWLQLKLDTFQNCKAH